MLFDLARLPSTGHWRGVAVLSLRHCAEPRASENATQTATQCSRRFSKSLKRLVGAGRFELPTPCSRSKCATSGQAPRLRAAVSNLSFTLVVLIDRQTVEFGFSLSRQCFAISGNRGGSPVPSVAAPCHRWQPRAIGGQPRAIGGQPRAMGGSPVPSVASPVPSVASPVPSVTATREPSGNTPAIGRRHPSPWWQSGRTHLNFISRPTRRWRGIDRSTPHRWYRSRHRWDQRSGLV